MRYFIFVYLRLEGDKVSRMCPQSLVFYPTVETLKLNTVMAEKMSHQKFESQFHEINFIASVYVVTLKPLFFAN